jgi:hypothetical protein
MVSRREDVVVRVGVDARADVMHGFNGTILAYGQTGSVSVSLYI